MITILQATNREQQKLLDITGPVWQQYADNHGYGYSSEIRELTEKKHGRWIKWDAISDALNTIQDGTWLFWCDADTMPIDVSVELETFIPRVKPGIYLIVPEYKSQQACDIVNLHSTVEFKPLPYKVHGNWVYLNTGNFFIYSCQWSRDFAQIMQRNEKLRGRDDFKKYRRDGDEIVLEIYLLGYPEHRRRAVFIESDPFFKQEGWGSFSIHPAGMTVEEKVTVLKSYRERIQW